MYSDVPFWVAEHGSVYVTDVQVSNISGYLPGRIVFFLVRYLLRLVFFKSHNFIAVQEMRSLGKLWCESTLTTLCV